MTLAAPQHSPSGGANPRNHFRYTVPPATRPALRDLAGTRNALTIQEFFVIELDARGLDCPLPLLKAKQALNKMPSGEQLRVQATDPGSQRDFQAFARQSGHTLRACDVADGVFIYILQKR